MTARRRFDPDITAVSEAREFVVRSLDGRPPSVVEVVSLLVSELVTNAVLHAKSDFEVDVREAVHGGVRVEVTDFGGGEPVARGPAPSEPRGRGLQIVESLASRWGVERDDLGDVTTTWFEIDADPRSPADGSHAQ